MESDIELGLDCRAKLTVFPTSNLYDGRATVRFEIVLSEVDGVRHTGVQDPTLGVIVALCRFSDDLVRLSSELPSNRPPPQWQW